MAVQAGLGLDGAHALSQSNASDTALAYRGSDKTAQRYLGIDQKGLWHPSNQMHLERSFREVTPEQLKQMGVKNPERFIRNVQLRDQNLQQRAQKHAQRQDQRKQLAENTQEPLENLRTLFEEVTEKAKENPEFGQRVRKLLEEKRRKLDEPCLQDSFPASSVRGAVLEVEGGGTVLQVLSDLGTTNICSDPVSSVQFGRIISYTCPPDCTPSTGGSAPEESFVEGVPSTIAQYATSKGSATDQIYCLQTDSNGRKTPVAPSSTLYIVWPQGIQKGSTIRGKSIPYYPPRS